ncbi:MAG: DUF932 domain-containing protein [Gammaproteobacteria bacterium]|nr:DUF932 domain-containing protein [Gammaproteobacteria bacterium]
MSAEVESIAWAGNAPWHGMGKNVQHDRSPREMQIAAGLDWHVEKVPLQYEHEQRIRDADQFALVRSTDGTMLDIIKSDNWEPVQNDAAFEFFDRFVTLNRMTMDVAGSLRDGKIVFVLAKMNQNFVIGSTNEDRTDGYLLFTNPHRYGQAVDIRLTPIRVVCMNTLSLALSTASKAAVKFSHRRTFDVEAAQSVFKESLWTFSNYGEMARFLAVKRYSNQALQHYFDECFPYVPNMHTRRPVTGQSSANAKRALEVVESQPGAAYATGTWWNAVNAVTYLTDHKVGNSAETRLHSAWYGKGERRKRQALELAIKYAEAA